MNTTDNIKSLFNSANPMATRNSYEPSGVCIGDTVLVQKAGEIIPEILSVVREKRPEGTVPFHMPDTCPECGAPVVRDPDGAALRCTGAECPAQRLRNIAHFVSREAMDIDGLGISLCQSLINSGLVRSPAELYSLEPQAVAALDHMGKKSAENLIAAIEKSKDAGMARLLCAFGIRQVGQKAAKVLAMHFGTLDKLMAATEDELMAIPDVGPTTAAYLRAWFANPQSQHQIRLLRAAGVSFESKEQVVDHRFAGKTFVLTGALTMLPPAHETFELFTQLYGVEYIIPENATFATAIGAALYSMREDG